MAVLPFSMQIWLELQRSTLFSNHIFPLLLFLLVFSLGFKLLHARSGTKFKLPPSPPKLPIIGNLHQLGRLPHQSLRALSDKYGPVMLLHLGCKPTIVVSSADMVKEMVKNHDIVFSNRPKTRAADVFFYECLDVGFAPYSEYWRQARKVCVLELLSLKRVLSFDSVRDEETEELVCKIRDASLRGKMINLSETLIANLNNIASRSILGRKFHEEDKRSKFGEISKRVMIQFTAFSFGDYFPWLRWMDVFTGLSASFKKTFRELDPLLEQIIEEHKASSSEQDHLPSKEKDFVDILLQLQEDDMLGMELANVNLKAILFDMFVAGSDTTSQTVEWVIAELLNDTRKMKKAQEEVRKIVGKKSKIDINDLNKMEYLRCIVKETLRLHPPVVLLYRATSASVKLGGYDIPPNIWVFVNAWAIQRDPNVWDRPEEFIPERFENKEVDYIGQDCHYIPFGFGRRGCPGLTFGLFALELVIANLLHWFDWKLPGNNTAKPEELFDMDEIFGLTVHKKNPLLLLPIPYSP